MVKEIRKWINVYGIIGLIMYFYFLVVVDFIEFWNGILNV